MTSKNCIDKEKPKKGQLPTNKLTRNGVQRNCDLNPASASLSTGDFGFAQCRGFGSFYYGGSIEGFPVQVSGKREAIGIIGEWQLSIREQI